MDTLLDLDVKKAYNKCKLRVKLWEHEFKKQHGRLPSKHDIREAESEVCFAYKTYFHLKSNALEQSFVGITGFESDEGKEMEQSKITLKPTTEAISNWEEVASDGDCLHINANAWGDDLRAIRYKVTKNTPEQSNINALFSKKLFDGSRKLAKRNPRKSLSFSHKKSDKTMTELSSISIKSCQDTSDSKSQTILSDKSPEISESQDYINEFSSIHSSNLKIASAQSTVNAKSLDIIQSVLSNDYKPRRTLDFGWIARVSKSTGTEISESNIENFAISQKYTKLANQQETKIINYESDDIIENSDDESLQNVMHVAKKFKTNSFNTENSVRGRSDTNGSKLCVISMIDKNQISKENISFNCENVLQVPRKLSENIMDNGQSSGSLQNVNSEVEVNKSMKKSNKRTLKTSKQISNAALRKENTISKPDENHTKQPVTLRKSLRTKQKVKFREEADSDADSIEGDEFNDPNFSLAESLKKKKNFLCEHNDSTPIQKQVERAASKKNNSQIPDKSVMETYELEYSVKQRILTVPRITNVDEVIKKLNKQKKITQIPKSQMSNKERFEERIDSGNLNENFVRIDLKKKVFVRGKKNFTYSKYKKSLWKKKKQAALAGPDMDMGGCDGGVMKCFHCGDTGHFARQCTKRAGDALLPIDPAQDKELYSIPTLQEAEEMAQTSILAIRKSCRGKCENTRKKLEVDQHSEEKSSSNDSMDSDDDMLLVETLKLEEYIKNIDMQEYLDSTSVVKPYYPLNEDDSIIDTPEEVFNTLAMFGYTSFRPGQELAIMRILSGKSTLVTLSTGSGKSLCYQLPAYLYSKRERCISLIISPLVSLMEDQVVGLPGFLKAACLHTNQTKTQREKIKELIRSGGLNILLVSPEAVVAGERSMGFGSFLRSLPPIAFACIDETHCVSQWSHNFRPSYLMICRILRERLGVGVILGLTATATRHTCDNIVEHLQIHDGLNGIISDVPLPNNLRFTVSKDINRDYALLSLLLSESFAKYKSIIVYCTRREECERIAKFLRTSLKEEKSAEMSNKKRKRMSCQAEPYHAGMAASRRKFIQKSFMSGELRIVVATVAFGMGINKSDIRAVIHYNMPNSFEGYVQEVGRAGRDSLPAHCHLFLDTYENDENELQRHIYANSIDRHVIRKLLEKIFIPCSCKETCSKHEVAFSIQTTVVALDAPEENISTLLCYLELDKNRYVEVLSPAYTWCRIISYNGPTIIKKSAKDCPPLAMALAKYGDQQAEENVFEFPVVDVAAFMGWDSGICKHKLKNLEWITINNVPKRSNLSVQFSNLGFRLLAPGNLTNSQLDEALDNLYSRVKDQERQGLLQLHAIHSALTEVSERSFNLCINDVTEKEINFKKIIRDYFECPDPLSKVEIKNKSVNEDQIVTDTRQLVAMYKDNSFTGRAVARIFYGIQSPNYPAFIWGRCKFWRSHLKEDFDQIYKIATREIIKMRT